MTLNDLKEQLLDKWKEISGKVMESESVIQLTEKYRNLSPNAQKAVVAGLVIFAGYMVYSVPASFINSSKEYEASFETNRALIRGLFRSARNPTISADKFRGPGFDDMKSRVDGFLANNQVIESQKGAFAPANKPLKSKLLPNAVRQEGMTFEVKKLNLKQAVTLSEQLAGMHPNAKLAGVEIVADAADPHYYNVKYTLSSLSLPIKEDKPKEPKKKR